MAEQYTLLHLEEVEQTSEAPSLQLRSVARVDVQSGQVLLLNVVLRDNIKDALLAFGYVDPETNEDKQAAVGYSVSASELRRVAKEEALSVDKLVLKSGWSRGTLRIPMSLLSNCPQVIAVWIIYQRFSAKDPLKSVTGSTESVTVDRTASGPLLPWGFSDGRSTSLEDILPALSGIDAADTASKYKEETHPSDAASWEAASAVLPVPNIEHMVVSLQEFSTEDLCRWETIDLFVTTNGTLLTEELQTRAMIWARSLLLGVSLSRAGVYTAYRKIGRAIHSRSTGLSMEASKKLLFPKLNKTLTNPQQKLASNIVPWLAGIASAPLSVTYDPHPLGRHGQEPRDTVPNPTIRSVLRTLHGQEYLQPMAEWMVSGMSPVLVDCYNSNAPIARLDDKIIAGETFQSLEDTELRENCLYLHRAEGEDGTVFYTGHSIDGKVRVKTELRFIRRYREEYLAELDKEEEMREVIKATQHAWEVFGKLSSEANHQAFIIASYGTQHLTLAETVGLYLAESFGIWRLDLWGHPRYMELGNSFGGLASTLKVEQYGLSYRAEDVDGNFYVSANRDSGLGNASRPSEGNYLEYTEVCQELGLKMVEATSAFSKRETFALTGELWIGRYNHPGRPGKALEQYRPDWRITELWDDSSIRKTGQGTALYIPGTQPLPSSTFKLRFRRGADMPFFAVTAGNEMVQISGSLSIPIDPTAFKKPYVQFGEFNRLSGDRFTAILGDSSLFADFKCTPAFGKKAEKVESTRIMHTLSADTTSTKARFASSLDTATVTTLLKLMREHKTCPLNISADTLKRIAWEFSWSKDDDELEEEAGALPRVSVGGPGQTSSNERVAALSSSVTQIVQDLFGAIFGVTSTPSVFLLKRTDPALLEKINNIQVQLVEKLHDGGVEIVRTLTWANLTNTRTQARIVRQRMVFWLQMLYYADRVLLETL